MLIITVDDSAFRATLRSVRVGLSDRRQSWSALATGCNRWTEPA